MPKLIVIADDFTGANDTGVQLTKKGAAVTVALQDKPVDCDIPVINTESRAISPEKAAAAVTTAVKNNVSNDTKVVFKKIDSTFRGNIGAELEAAASAFNAKLIVVASAIPAAGRTTNSGKCLVNGTPVAETEFATDPKTPVKFSEIDKIIGAQSSLPCRIVELQDIRSGKLPSVINEGMPNEVPLVLITDAETEDDLALVAQTLAGVDTKMVLVGAAGIANQLSRNMFLHSSPPPVLILAGSMSEVVQKQVENCAIHGLHVLDVDSHDIWHHPGETLDKTFKQAVSLLESGKHCAIQTAFNKNERQRAVLFCREQKITGTELGAAVAGFLGKLGKTLMESQQLSGTLLTGGDIAMAVAEEMGADGYVIEGEVLPCIPYGHFTGHDTKVVTKAGGFGAPNAMEKIITFLQDNS